MLVVLDWFTELDTKLATALRGVIDCGWVFDTGTKADGDGAIELNVGVAGEGRIAENWLYWLAEDVDEGICLLPKVIIGLPYDTGRGFATDVYCLILRLSIKKLFRGGLFIIWGWGGGCIKVLGYYFINAWWIGGGLDPTLNEELTTGSICIEVEVPIWIGT